MSRTEAKDRAKVMITACLTDFVRPVEDILADHLLKFEQEIRNEYLDD